MIQQFNLDEALELVKQGARIDGKDGVLAPLIKQLTEAARKRKVCCIVIQVLSCSSQYNL